MSGSEQTEGRGKRKWGVTEREEERARNKNLKYAPLSILLNCRIGSINYKYLKAKCLNSPQNYDYYWGTMTLI